MTTDSFGRELNHYGRPHNWADNTVDEMLHAYALAGNDGMKSQWLIILDRDKPLQISANAMFSRLHKIIKAK